MFGSEAPERAVLDMALSRAEFVRQLHAAFPEAQQTGPDAFSGDAAGLHWTIRLQASSPLQLGRLRLERWTVNIALPDATAQQRGRWWQRFSAHFQKGGG